MILLARFQPPVLTKAARVDKISHVEATFAIPAALRVLPLGAASAAPPAFAPYWVQVLLLTPDARKAGSSPPAGAQWPRSPPAVLPPALH